MSGVFPRVTGERLLVEWFNEWFKLVATRNPRRDRRSRSVGEFTVENGRVDGAGVDKSEFLKYKLKKKKFQLNLPKTGLGLSREFCVDPIRSFVCRVVDRSTINVSTDVWGWLTLAERLPGVTIRIGEVARSHVSLFSLVNGGNVDWVFGLNCFEMCWRCFSWRCQILYGQ